MVLNISFPQNLSLPFNSGSFLSGESCLKQNFLSLVLPLPICIDEKKSTAIYCKSICKFAQDATLKWVTTSGIVNNEGRRALKSLWAKVFNVFNMAF